MTLAEVDEACRALPGVTMVVQWGNLNVYKVGGKVFVMASDESVSFKASEIAYEAYCADGRGQRAPYTQPGAGWLNLSPLAEQDRAEIAGLLSDAHGLIAAKLTKAKRREIGLA